MDILNDPSMKEIIQDFCEETEQLFVQLVDTLEKYEQDMTEGKHLEKFGQIIDRVMGAAKSIGAKDIATFCELGKTIGYKSSQSKDENLLNVTVAVLFDSMDLLEKMVKQLKTGDSKGLEGLNTQAFVSRLKWLSDKFKDIERSSCAVEKEPPATMSQNSIDDLLSDLGL